MEHVKEGPAPPQTLEDAFAELVQATRDQEDARVEQERANDAVSQAIQVQRAAGKLFEDACHKQYGALERFRAVVTVRE